MLRGILRALHATAIVVVGVSIAPTRALAWGDEGHEVVALVADHFLEPVVREKVRAMLAADTDNLTAHDIASEATWADKYRDSDRNTTKERYNATRQWHFIDIELDHPDIDAACFGHPAIPSGTVASLGPADDCIVDKINEFAAELSSKATSPEERLTALKFLLHFVGDLHQPLHASDDHDAGGNRVRVTASGFPPGNLHRYWDTDFIEYVGDDPKELADDLVGGISQSKSDATMSKGSASDWALEAFKIAKEQVYGRLSPKGNDDGSYGLDPAYVTAAIETVHLQLARAGVRLAAVLNHALGNGT